MMEALSNLTLGEIAGWVAIGLVALSSIVEISPIKINPWSWLGKQIGKAINGEVIAKVDSLQEEISDVKRDVSKMQEINDERNAKSARTRILRFGDEILHGVKHSKDHFDEILLCGTEYDQFCREHPDFKNHMTERTMKLITKTYDKCLEENSFL